MKTFYSRKSGTITCFFQFPDQTKQIARCLLACMDPLDPCDQYQVMDHVDQCNRYKRMNVWIQWIHVSNMIPWSQRIEVITLIAWMDSSVRVLAWIHLIHTIRAAAPVIRHVEPVGALVDFLLSALPCALETTMTKC